jgi:hypothetical protein
MREVLKKLAERYEVADESKDAQTAKNIALI